MPIIDNSSSDFFFDQKTELEDIKNTIVEMVTKRIPNFKKIDTTKIQVLKMPIADRQELHDHVQSTLPKLFSFDVIGDKELDDSYKKVFKNSVYFTDANYSKILKAKISLHCYKHIFHLVRLANHSLKHNQ